MRGRLWNRLSKVRLSNSSLYNYFTKQLCQRTNNPRFNEWFVYHVFFKQRISFLHLSSQATRFFCKSEHRTLPISLNSTNCPKKWTSLSLPGLFLKRRKLQYYLEILFCWPLKETIEEELQLHWVHMSLSASKITKVGHSSKKGKYCKCNEMLYETVSLLWYIGFINSTGMCVLLKVGWSKSKWNFKHLYLFNNICRMLNTLQGQFSCSGDAGKQTWLKIRAQSTSIFLSTFTFQKYKHALWRLNLVLYRSKQN